MVRCSKRPETASKRYLKRILASEDRDEGHVNNCDHGAGYPHLEIPAPEPVLMGAPSIHEEEPETELCARLVSVRLRRVERVASVPSRCVTLSPTAYYSQELIWVQE